MKRVNENRFFETLKFHDIEKIRKFSRILALVFCVMMFLLTLSALFFAWSLAVKPTPVIAFDKDGRRMVFSEAETLELSTNEVRIHRFLSDFINKFDGISPNIDEDLKEAYNMLTPKFRQILLDRSVHNEKIDTWKNKNFETKFKITKLKIVKGSFLVGSSVTIEGLGETTFGNAVDYSGESEKKTTLVWFSALLIVVPVTLELSPDGLLVDFYAGKSFEDFRALRAYLTENSKEYLLENEKEQVE
ncbi:hypothetical protein J6Z19_08755 [bacterium]|nr:hypothetical protein [bacterium]